MPCNNKPIIATKYSVYAVTAVLAFCSIIYELLLAQTLTEIFGNSVLRYAMTIGIYLFAMGVGAIAHPLLSRTLIPSLIGLEIVLSLTGLCVVFLLFLFAYASFEYPLGSLLLCHVMIVVVGFLSGMEIPYLVNMEAGKRFSRILCLDFIGTLIGTLCFPLALYPNFTLFEIGFYTALLNILAAIYLLTRSTGIGIKTKIGTVVCAITFLIAMPYHKTVGDSLLVRYEIKRHALNWGGKRENWPEIAEKINVLNITRTRYQKIMLLEDTHPGVATGKSLYLDKNIQLQDWWIDSYHETLSLTPLLFQHKPQLDIAILGGGDGILARHLLNSGRVNHIDLIDIDSEFIAFMKTHPHYVLIHLNALDDDRVSVHIADAYAFIRENSFSKQAKKYDIVILDLPGLKDGDKLIHLYSKEFFTFINKSLRSKGVMATWHYNTPRHKKILSSTLSASGFDKVLYTCSRANQVLKQNSVDDQQCVEHFLLAHAGNTTPLPYSQWDMSDYQHTWIENHRQSLSWQVLENSDQQVNSIFKPNYKLIPGTFR